MSKFVRLHLLSHCSLIAEVPDDWQATRDWFSHHSFLENQHNLWELADKDGAFYKLADVETFPVPPEVPADVRWDSHKKTIVHK